MNRSRDVAAVSPLTTLQWSYEAQFRHRWTQFHLSSGLMQVTPGIAQSLAVDEFNVQVKIPQQGSGTIGLLVGDPCIRADSWCIYADTFKTKENLQAIINSLALHDELDYWMNVGDLFYDQSGDTTEEFFAGLTVDAQSRIHGATMGNHDYWIGGAPGANSPADSFANGHMQWYAQDSYHAAKFPNQMFDFSADPESSQIAAAGNFFWYYSVGNVAFIGFSNAYSWADTEMYFREACSWVESESPGLVVLLGHWNSGGMGCQDGMDDADVYSKVQGLPGCNALGQHLKYIEGHKHCNMNFNPGFMLGSFGMMDGDSSCHGAFGVPILDTRGGRARLMYFELGVNGARTALYDEVLGCLRGSGYDACKHYAQTWMDEPLAQRALAV